MSVGGDEVTIPNETDEDIFSVTRALFDETAFLPWYKNCMVGQAEKLLTPTKARELADLPPDRRERKGIELVETVAAGCAQPGRPTLKPNATPAELAPIRAQTVLSVEAQFANEGASRAEQRCAGRSMEELSDAEIVEMSNASLQRGEELFLQTIDGCIQ